MTITTAVPLYLADPLERRYLAEFYGIEMTYCLQNAREALQASDPDMASRECFLAFFDFLLPLVCHWQDICPCAAPTGLSSVQVFREYRRLSQQNDGVAEDDREWERALLSLAAHILVADLLIRRGRPNDADVVLCRFQRLAAYQLLWGDDAERDTVDPPPPSVDPNPEVADLLHSLQL
tara:strand:+ start:188 stop:724 length:537 start_codon:yes stop_codon:yes gene_type:complete